MANKLVITATYVTINAVAYQANIGEATFKADVPSLVTTNMSSAGWEELLGGIKKGAITLKFLKDSDMSTLDAALWALLGTVVPWTMKETVAANSASNPQYSGNMLINSWTPLKGAVGTLLEDTVTFPNSGPVTRATS
jgi:hypothetical protein